VLSVWRADWLQDHYEQRSLEASVERAPWSAENHRLLGLFFLNVAQDSRRAIQSLHHAVELDPYDARYWLDLADAYEVQGAEAESEKALVRALQAEPTSPAIAWKAANFYLARNNDNRALPLFRTALQYNPAYTTTALDLCWRATKNVSQITSQALPADPAPYFALLKILIAQKESEPANELWSALIARKLAFPVEQSFLYFDYLIQTNQVDQAKQVWTDLHTLDDSPPNLVRNGGFEADFLNGGFEWRYTQITQAEVSFDASERHSGARSLRIEFAGPAVADAAVYEYALVQPNTAYRLSAFVETRDIVSASGPRLGVEDPSTKKILATTDEFQDSSSWKQMNAEFVTGPDARLVAIRIIRTPGNLLITGTLWLDDIELVPTVAVRSPSQ
jgi:tetratricopeptide (TPR) repeat protein